MLTGIIVFIVATSITIIFVCLIVASVDKAQIKATIHPSQNEIEALTQEVEKLKVQISSLKASICDNKTINEHNEDILQ